MIRLKGQKYRIASKRTVVVVIGVIALMGFILGLLLISKSRHGENRSICLSNLSALHAKKQQWAHDHGATNGSVVVEEEFLDYVLGHEMPSCPSGGQYMLGRIGKKPRCSVHGDLLGN